MESKMMKKPFSRRGFLRTLSVGVCATGFVLSAGDHAFATDRPGRIHWSNSNTTVNPLWEFYVDNVPLDGVVLNDYAKMRYGATASAYLERNHAYSWRIKYRQGNRWVVVGINMLDVADFVGRNRWGIRVRNHGCYFVNWNGNTWRGIYIVRGRS
jgi:hypothetical protein